MPTTKSTADNSRKAKIIEAIKDRRAPWKTVCTTDPNSGFPTNCFTNKIYSGINVLYLNFQSEEAGFRSKYWGTYKQWNSKGFKVKKMPEDWDSFWGLPIIGPKNTTIVYNAEQVYGKSRDYKIDNERILTESVVDYNVVDNIISEINANYVEDEKTFYERPPKDVIHLPHKEKFATLSQYYNTQFHELIHWSEWRRGWKGDAVKGELIAEIGAGMIEQMLNIPHCNDNTNYKKYVDVWVSQIEDNANYLVDAAKHAFEAMKYLLKGKLKDEFQTN